MIQIFRSQIPLIDAQGDISLGDVNVTTPTREYNNITTPEETGAFNIPAGALYVKITNAGTGSGGGVPNTATVNGNDFSVGRTEDWEADSLPAFIINGNGSLMQITIATQ